MLCISKVEYVHCVNHNTHENKTLIPFLQWNDQKPQLRTLYLMSVIQSLHRHPFKTCEYFISHVFFIFLWTVDNVDIDPFLIWWFDVLNENHTVVLFTKILTIDFGLKGKRQYCSFSQKFWWEYLRVKSVVTLRQF